MLWLSRYTSEQEAEAAYEAYEDENDSEDEDLEQRKSPLSRGAKAAAAAAAALKGGVGKAKRPHAASLGADGSPTKKARTAPPDGDAGTTDAALSANRSAGGVSALDCGPVHRKSAFCDLACFDALCCISEMFYVPGHEHRRKFYR